jgi:cytochrome oxidase Cu insertion factor (SCO1/SenC/PrrC family)
VVAVSVNGWGNARIDLLQDDRKWRLGPEWRWAIGSPDTLAAVWRSYGIGVLATTKTIAGVTIHEITHTEASYLVDRTGHERDLFVWPFPAEAVDKAILALDS